MAYKNLIDWNTFIDEEVEIKALADREETEVQAKLLERSMKK